MIVKSVVNSVRTNVYLVLLKCLVDLFTHFQAELVKLHSNFFYILKSYAYPFMLCVCVYAFNQLLISMVHHADY